MQSCIPGGGEVRPVLRQLTSQAPIITQIEGLLTPAECDALVQRAEKAGFLPSRTGGFRGEGRTSAHRTSRTSYLPEDDPVVACVGRRLATVAAMPWGGLEPLQATRYTIGQQYQSHHDAPTGSRGRQRRLKTIFAYLQADGGLPAGNCGGATRFDGLRQQDGKPLRVYPAVGRAVMWNNYDDGRRDPRTHHGGEMVTCPGVEKIGLNAWFHGAKPRQAAGKSRTPVWATKHTARKKRGSPRRAMRSRSRK